MSIWFDRPCYKCRSHTCDMSCPEPALTEKQDNTAALNVQYHEASMRKFFGAEKQEPVAMRFPHTDDWDKVTCPTCNATFNVETAPVAEQEPEIVAYPGMPQGTWPEPEDEQEPVAWAKLSAKGKIFDLLEEPDGGAAPLYTHPAPVNQQLLSALNAMLTYFGMDEDEWSKPTFDKARAAIKQAEKEKT